MSYRIGAMVVLAVWLASIAACGSSKTEPQVNTKAGQRLLKPASNPQQ